MERLLEDKNTYRIIRADPTKELMKTNNNIINDLNKGQYISTEEKRNLFCSAANAPRIYGLPKIHKVDIPLRPIVSSIQVPCYNLGKYVGNVLKSTISRQYNVKNSMEVKQKLSEIKLDQDDIMVSFDVVSLFTNIPTHTAINIIMNKWNKIREKTNIPRSKFIDILKFCLLDNNYFMYNDKIYRQIFGMPMGNPLSPTIADIVLDDLLDVALAELESRNVRIKYIAKYVDDILTIINKKDVEEILLTFNKYNTKIQFTYEVEKDKEIAYLDMKLHRNEDKINFNWHMKETSSGRLINFNATQPKHQIFNTAKNFIRRVLDISDQKFYQHNIKKIYSILNSNGFPNGLIGHFLNAYRQIPNNEGGNSAHDHLFYSIKYIPGLTDNKNIKSTINKNNIKLAYKPNKILNTIFTKTKTPIDESQQNNVVYEIPCKGKDNNKCDLVYIGTTKRSLETRLNEHKADMKKNKESTALSQHITRTNHEPDFDNAKILDKINNTRKRYITESLRIQQKIQRTMNIKEDTDKLSLNYKLAVM